MSDFVFHVEAALDLEDIWEYIALDSRESADRVHRKIVSAIEEMVTLPYRGHSRPDLTRRPILFLSVYEYLIAYDPDERPILILAVIHGRRNPQLIAAILKSRSIH